MQDRGADRPIGRDAELFAIDNFLVAATQHAAGLVLEGPAGIGKSTLLVAAIEEARRRGLRVLSARPSGVEATWAYQSLTDLFQDAGEDAVAMLPGPQREALEIALLRVTPRTAPDDASTHARAISLGTLNALLVAARAQPLLLAIDDAPWIDPATAGVLSFVFARLQAHPIGVLLTQRVEEPGRAPLDLDRLVTTQRLWLEPLTVGALHLLLADHLGLTLPRPTHVRLHQMAGGNPFHGLEIGRALQRLPSLPRPGEPLPVPDSIRDLIRAHLATVTEATRATLLVAAAAGSPTTDELRRAAGPRADLALEEAADRSLLAVESGVVRFSHPSLASAVYEDAPPEARRKAHAALAKAIDEPEARGRHLALATNLPDADVAAALEAAARDAKQRGAADAAAELGRLAVDRTPTDDEPSRQRRRLLLANLLMELPDLPAAEGIAEDLVATLPPGIARAEAGMLLGTIAWYTKTAQVAVARTEAALPDAADDPDLLGRLHYRLAIFNEHDQAAAVRHAKTAIKVLEDADSPVSLAGAMFEQFLATVALGAPPPLDLLERAIAVEGSAYHLDQSTVPGIWWLAIDRTDLARARFEDMLERSRAAGETAGEADLLTRLAETELYADRWTRALELADEATVTARQEGQVTADPARRIRALIDAHLGGLAEARVAAEEGLKRAEEAGERLIAASYLLVMGLVAASEGKPAVVETIAEQSAGHLNALGRIQPLRLDLMPERIEALVALRRIDEAEGHLERFSAGARVVPRPWADAAIARGTARLRAAQGRLDEGVAATDPAVDARSNAWRRFDRARTLLVRGELLRQARARRDAGIVLETALGAFEDLEAAAWADRTRAELARLGRHRPGSEELTPTERRVAELAASGLRNREVAEELGISAKTVEAHLAQVYAKLSIRSRAELGRRIS